MILRPSDIQVKKRFHLTGHAAGIFAIGSGPADHLFYTGGGDGLIAEWNLQDPEHALGVARVPGNIFSLLYVAEKQLIVAGDLHGGVHVIDTVTKQEIHKFSCDGATVYDIRRYDDNRLLLGCGNGIAYLFNLTQSTVERRINISGASIRQINRGSYIVFACSDHKLYVYNNDLTPEAVLEGHTNSVFCSLFTDHEKLLISGSRDAQMRVWDPDQHFECIQTIPAHMFTINDMQIDPTGRVFATAGRDKHIKLWGAEQFQLLKVIDAEKFGGHINSVNKLFWSNWNNCIISCGDDRSVQVWEITIPG